VTPEREPEVWTARGWERVTNLHWRVGRKVGRTIYAMVATEPDPEDALIGLVDHPHIALQLVREHNEALNRGAQAEYERSHNFDRFR
jgi:hypothetical protein